MTTPDYDLDRALRRVRDRLQRLELWTARQRLASGTVGGDVGGTLPGATVVVGIGGVPFNGGTPSDDFVITYDAASGTFGWEAGGISGSFVTTSFGGKEDVHTVAASGATLTLDLTNGNLFDVTLTANCTLTFSGATAGKVCSFTLWARQDGTGSRLITWPGSVIWSVGAPTLATAINALDELVFVSTDGGASWLGHHVGGTPFSVTDGIVTVDPTVQLTFVGATLADLGSGNAQLTFSASGGAGQILISDTPSTPLVFADLIQNEAQTDLVYADV